MPSFMNLLIVALIIWRLSGFVAAYRPGKSAAAGRNAEREQQADWARRMQGPRREDK